MNKKIVGLGNAVLDIMTTVDDGFINKNNLSKGTMQIVDIKTSEKTLEQISIVNTDSGGSVANTISTVSMLGAQASFCGKVMDDKLGKDFENKMKESGANFLCKKSTSGLPTARCLVFVTPDGERTMQTFLGASTTLNSSDIKEEYFKDNEFLLVEGYLWSSDTARQAVAKAISFCKSNSKIIFSLSDPTLAKSFKEDFISFIKKDVDILIGNEIEFQELLDTNFDKKKISEFLNLDIAVITRGDKGADFIVSDTMVTVPGCEISNVIDTTGAGDMFAAGFIFKYMQGSSPQESIEFANKLAALIIQKYGARADKNMLEQII